MLEVPALALGLIAVVHFEKHLRDRRFRDALLACLFAACCALTRFDGVFLIPYFALRMASTRNWQLLKSRAVVWPVFVALAVFPGNRQAVEGSGLIERADVFQSVLRNLNHGDFRDLGTNESPFHGIIIEECQCVRPDIEFVGDGRSHCPHGADA